MTARRRSGRPRWILPVALFLFTGFLALGTWQLQRRVWKLDLIARVDQRVHADPVAAPGPDRWPGIAAVTDEYRRVQAVGRFLDDRQAFVQAVTELGAGYWVLTPLQRPDGSVLIVNRGFVTPESRAHVAPGGGPVTVTGLLRLTEPGGGFLRHNDPAADRWFSRDVQAIASARGLRSVAPYFVDAQQTVPAAAAGVQPVPGLTVIAFHNSHLVYAITWYTLALMVVAAAWRLNREEPIATDED